MDLEKILPFIQIGISILLAIAILLRQKGAGLSSAFGGSGSFYSTKRGFEKVLLVSTIVLAVLFIASGILDIALSQ